MSWFTWRRVVGVLAALAALLSGLLARGPRWRGRAENVAQRANQEATETVRRRGQEQEAEIAKDLEQKRSGTRAGRLAGALERARRRRAGS